MPTFDVFLARTYKVRIQASDAFTAERLAEEFIGDVQDISTERERAAAAFQIQSIETTDNSAFDALELER
ncbi:MAG: hypothetical protein BroJett039_12020 [Chloroflexota bacterium]|nr:MAG: hypothetical protein BroJett039_12020 [Chloroflexota bacterium]